MQTFGEFKPTGFDPPGAALPNMDDRRDWLVVPVSRCRDSGPLDESNFETTLNELGGENRTVEVHRLGHWGPGWFEIIIVKPGSKAAKIAEGIEAALADYPVLDDEDLGEREHEEYLEAWSFTGCGDFTKQLVYKAEHLCDEEVFSEAELNFIEEALNDASSDQMREFYEAHADQPYENGNDGVYLTIEYAVAAVTEQELRAFAHRLRGEEDPAAPDPNQGVLPL